MFVSLVHLHIFLAEHFLHHPLKKINILIQRVLLLDIYLFNLSKEQILNNLFDHRDFPDPGFPDLAHDLLEGLKTAQGHKIRRVLVLNDEVEALDVE